MRHAWLVELLAKRLEAFELADGQWREIGISHGIDTIRIAPFDGIEVQPPWE